MKPNRVRMSLTENGSPRMFVPAISRVEDAIWEAVQEAISAGLTVEQFRKEAAEAWRQELQDQAERDAKAWSGR